MKIAICIEYPIELGGGVSVLAKALLDGLAKEHQLVLVSPDDRISETQLLAWNAEHLCWNPEVASRRAARQLADRLREMSVTLAHFHMGGNYGWNIRFP